MNYKILLFEKNRAYLNARVQTKKLYQSPNPNLKLNPNCNPSSNPNINPNQNSKYTLQLTTNVNNLQNTSIWANKHPLLPSYSLKAELILHAGVQIGTSFEKTPKY